jgi:hypothetical protein
MKIIQAYKDANKEWEYFQEKSDPEESFSFGNRYLLEKPEIIKDLRKEFYEDIVFGSTAGEIICCNVNDKSISVTAIEFEKSSFVVEREKYIRPQNAKDLGEKLYNKIPKENLKHLFVLSEGSFVNGSSLINGLEIISTLK